MQISLPARMDNRVPVRDQMPKFLSPGCFFRKLKLGTKYAREQCGNGSESVFQGLAKWSSPRISLIVDELLDTTQVIDLYRCQRASMLPRQLDAKITHRSEIGLNGGARQQNYGFREGSAGVVIGNVDQNIARVAEMKDYRVKVL